MGMDLADDFLDERPIPLRSMGPPDNVDAIEGLEIDTSEDVELLQTAPSPELPSAKMVEEHRHLHIPYRDLCKCCVMGRGTGFPHGRSGSSSIPQVGPDYFYITAGGVKVRAEREYAGDGEGNAALEEARKAGKIIKRIVVRCLASKMIFGHVVPYKGAGEDQFVCGLVVADIAWLGHRHCKPSSSRPSNAPGFNAADRPPSLRSTRPPMTLRVTAAWRLASSSSEGFFAP